MRRVIAAFELTGVAAASFVGFLLVRIAWTHSYPAGEKIVMTLLALAEVWCFVSTWRWSVSFRRVEGFGAAQLLLGPKPTDAIATRARTWGRHFRYAWMTVIACIVAMSYYIRRHG